MFNFMAFIVCFLSRYIYIILFIIKFRKIGFSHCSINDAIYYSISLKSLLNLCLHHVRRSELHLNNMVIAS